ncbi:hypothetical protein GLOTRDRAFT_132993 [Gloeophyllum trabeum ATCC 11539]|uniref:Uncharacterized protein n=1 Tax=Gloeophyllum trabeum (strain ATCC 11539 / FP-39264 / Madison 617) TaxID=670483 RepID=S7PWC3_GLOTA|nr:uncharacterized protein GLOTRDRAFT_132993 [Gloeophyllum trabeum ATCC 11539]EPQ51622.1 hypothetical protein GLOTRDRAFT_132993 [Gloeophyllum trabeum ATCC 11539]
MRGFNKTSKPDLRHCHCSECRGKLVPRQIKNKHEREQAAATSHAALGGRGKGFVASLLSKVRGRGRGGANPQASSTADAVPGESPSSLMSNVTTAEFFSQTRNSGLHYSPPAPGDYMPMDHSRDAFETDFGPVDAGNDVDMDAHANSLEHICAPITKNPMFIAPDPSLAAPTLATTACPDLSRRLPSSPTVSVSFDERTALTRDLQSSPDASVSPKHAAPEAVPDNPASNTLTVNIIGASSAPEGCLPALRRSTCPRQPRIVTEVLSLAEKAAAAANDPPLGLYDDPDDGDALQGDLATTLDSGDDSDESGAPRTAVPPAALALIDIKPLEPMLPAADTYSLSNKRWYVHAVLLVIYLQTVHHVTFRACGIILFTTRAIFLGLGVLSEDDRMPVSYKTVVRDLELEDRFQVHPACPDCQCLFPQDLPADAECPGCNVRLFISKHATIFEKLMGRAPPRP